MAEDEKKPDQLDELLADIEAGARAGGAREYLLDYLATSKSNVFNLLVTSPPTFDALLRVWGVAVGLDAIERDNKNALEAARAARTILTDGPREPGQADTEEN